MNQAIHAVDLLQWFVGMPARVAASTATLVQRGLEVEDTAVALLEWEAGARGAIEASTAAWPGAARRIELAGEHGSIALEDDRIVRWETRDPRPGDARQLEESERTSLPPAGRSAPSGECTGHARQIERFVAALRTGGAAPLAGTAGRNAVALIEAIYAAAETGRFVTLSPTARSMAIQGEQVTP